MSDKFYSREALAGYKRELLENSVVLVIGAGALGQNVIQNLSLSGIGEIRVIDKDEFEDHNRTRSPAYPNDEEQKLWGLSKACVVANKLKKLMTASKPKMLYSHAWIQEVGDIAFKDVSVVISCVDNPRARAYLADQTRWRGIPFVEAGFDGPNLSMSCYGSIASEEEALNKPCWRCAHQEVSGTFSCRQYAERAEEQGIIPAIQNGAATLAGMQCEAAIQLLHGNTELSFRAVDFNVQTGKSRIIELGTDPSCPGIHRRLITEPEKINLGSNATVRDILLYLQDVVGNAPVITRSEYFQNQFVWEDGGQVMAKPAWDWVLMPLTETDTMQIGEINQPTKPRNEFSLSTLSEILELEAVTVGIQPGSIIEAYDASRQGSPYRYFSLQGDIHDIFSLIQ